MVVSQRDDAELDIQPAPITAYVDGVLRTDIAEIKDLVLRLSRGPEPPPLTRVRMRRILYPVVLSLRLLVGTASVLRESLARVGDRHVAAYVHEEPK